nr:mediator of RNA polymerase II transcription subunit 22-like [Saimiri boliviensis boliviensis]
MAQQRALPQSKETLLQSYNKWRKDDIKSIRDNFTEIIKTAKIEDETQVSRATQGEQDNYEMHVQPPISREDRRRTSPGPHGRGAQRALAT